MFQNYPFPQILSRMVNCKPLQECIVHLRVFSREQHTQWCKKSTTKVPNQKVTRRPKCFLSFFLSFFFFTWASSKLCTFFTIISTQKSAFHSELLVAYKLEVKEHNSQYLHLQIIQQQNKRIRAALLDLVRQMSICPYL